MASASRRRLALVAVALAATAAGALFLRGGPSPLDTHLSLALQRAGGEGFWRAASTPGDGFLAPAAGAGVAAALLAARRGRRAGLLLLAFCAVAFAFGQGVKAVVARARPGEPVRVVGRAPTTGSYPSGHVLWFTTLAGGAAVLGIAPRRRPLRTAAGALATAYALVLGASRVALGHHHATDVLAGYALAVALVASLAVAVERPPPPPASPPP